MILIYVKVIQEVATDIEALVKYTSDIRGKAAKIQSLTEKIDEDLDEIKTAVGNYQNKIKEQTRKIRSINTSSNNGKSLRDFILLIVQTSFSFFLLFILKDKSETQISLISNGSKRRSLKKRNIS
jgi:predicted PurR-regulated permease PerM